MPVGRRLDHGTVYKSLAVVLMGLSAVAMSAACVMLTDGAAVNSAERTLVLPRIRSQGNELNPAVRQVTE